jgi:hypothetical protein
LLELWKVRSPAVIPSTKHAAHAPTDPLEEKYPAAAGVVSSRSASRRHSVSGADGYDSASTESDHAGSASESGSEASDANSSSQPSSPRVKRPMILVEDTPAASASVGSGSAVSQLLIVEPPSSSSTSTSGAASAPAVIPSLTALERESFSIFFETGFDAVHPLFRPPEEPTLVVVQRAVLGERGNEVANPLLIQAAAAHPTSGLTAALPPASAASSSTKQSSRFPRLSASFTPSLSHARPFGSPLARTLPGARVEGREPKKYEPDQRSEAQREKEEELEKSNVESTAPSALLSLPPSSSLPELQTFLTSLLFHSPFPAHILPELVSRCVVAPLATRYKRASGEFMRAVVQGCGMMDVSGHTFKHISVLLLHPCK